MSEAALKETAAILGLKRTLNSSLELMPVIRKGLSSASLESVSKRLESLDQRHGGAPRPREAHRGATPSGEAAPHRRRVGARRSPGSRPRAGRGDPREPGEGEPMAPEAEPRARRRRPAQHARYRHRDERGARGARAHRLRRDRLTVLFWRICRKARAATTFDGEGARRYPGRWNHRDVPVVYCSSSLSLATLEYFVHVDPDDIPDDLRRHPRGAPGRRRGRAHRSERASERLAPVPGPRRPQRSGKRVGRVGATRRLARALRRHANREQRRAQPSASRHRCARAGQTGPLRVRSTDVEMTSERRPGPRPQLGS